MPPFPHGMVMKYSHASPSSSSVNVRKWARCLFGFRHFFTRFVAHVRRSSSPAATRSRSSCHC